MHSKSYRFLTPLIMVLTWANMEAQTSHPVPRLDRPVAYGLYGSLFFAFRSRRFQ